MSDSHAANQEAANQEFDDLAATLCDGRITADQLQRLEQIASNDPALLSTLVDLLNVDARLRQTSKGEASADAIMQAMSEAEVEPIINELAASPARRFSMETRHMAIGITIAVAFVVTSISIAHQILLPVRVATEGKDGKKRTKDAKSVESIARLVNDVEAKWEGHVRNPVFDRRQRIKTGMKLYPGQKLKLVSGLAEFKFFNGAEVVLEGPAEFEVLGKKVCRLEQGKLVAKAFEERSKGFVVDTPTGLVEDLGTEFGVEIDRHGDLDVHVLDGEVTLEERMADGSLGPPLAIKRGHFGAITRTEGVRTGKTIESTKFVRRFIYGQDTKGVGTLVAAFDQDSNGKSRSPTQSFVGGTFASLIDSGGSTGTKVWSAEDNGITLVVTNGEDRDRDRGIRGKLTNHPLADLYRDFTHFDSQLQEGHFTVKLAGLEAKRSYQLVWFTYDNSENATAGQYGWHVYRDSVAAENVIFSKRENYNQTANPDAVGRNVFVITSNQDGEILMVVGRSGTLGSDEGRRAIAVFNGMEVRDMHEQASPKSSGSEETESKNSTKEKQENE